MYNLDSTNSKLTKLFLFTKMLRYKTNCRVRYRLGSYSSKFQLHLGRKGSGSVQGHVNLRFINLGLSHSEFSKMAVQ